MVEAIKSPKVKGKTITNYNFSSFQKFRFFWWLKSSDINALSFLPQKNALRIHTHWAVSFPLTYASPYPFHFVWGQQKHFCISMEPQDQLCRELEAARLELRLLRFENEDLKKKVADLEMNIGDKGRVHQCEVFILNRVCRTGSKNPVLLHGLISL